MKRKLSVNNADIGTDKSAKLEEKSKNDNNDGQSSSDESSEVSKNNSSKSSSESIKDQKSKNDNNDAQSSSYESSEVSKNNSSESDSETAKDKIVADFLENKEFNNEENFNRGQELIKNHVQNPDSFAICNNFTTKELKSRAYDLGNRVIDYNNKTTRAEVAWKELEDEELKDKNLDELEDTAQLIQDGYSLIEHCANNEAAVNTVYGLLSVIGG